MISNSKTVSAAAPLDVSNLYADQRARELRALLAGLRLQEIHRMRAMRERNPLEWSNVGDEGDSAASDESRELVASMAQLAASRVAAVESALERLRDGRYGVCEMCEEEIPVERLQAMPWTLLCVDCQQARESLSKRVGADNPILWGEDRTAAPSPADKESAEASEELPAEESVPRRRRGRPRAAAR